jgi:hypothetical protein
MNLSELVKIASSEEKAEGFLRSRGILKTFERCPFCKIGTSRFKLYILPFEKAIILSYENKSA